MIIVRFLRLSVVIGLFVALTACASQAPGTVTDDGAGFFSGMLHGFLMVFALVGSLFGDFPIFATPNTGSGYNFGFALGIASWIAVWKGSGGFKIEFG